ncbi:uncharacterized protein ARMOST_01456 [Armillaria ostoyae]|uniref:Uncharacterized protein n=1 Tax=Armillaria ostoyae TaxID=47428 RepID=A0A284QNY7_ARMOS|nr:uncharacterized protein ARMOST_01456 [Armillaria ostoyae]
MSVKDDDDLCGRVRYSNHGRRLIPNVAVPAKHEQVDARTIMRRLTINTSATEGWEHAYVETQAHEEQRNGSTQTDTGVEANHFQETVSTQQWRSDSWAHQNASTKPAPASRPTICKKWLARSSGGQAQANLDTRALSTESSPASKLTIWRDGEHAAAEVGSMMTWNETQAPTSKPTILQEMVSAQQRRSGLETQTLSRGERDRGDRWWCQIVEHCTP